LADCQSLFLCAKKLTAHFLVTPKCKYGENLVNSRNYYFKKSLIEEEEMAD